MSRRLHLLLIAGCVIVGGLELPAALRSLSETWRGPYALDWNVPVESAHVESSNRADASVRDALASPESTLPHRPHRPSGT